ncbi:uncharacterized protein LOC128868206 [Anastrepha ludens]|uniref:uncharacterized protein LOC128868206 n=1 Tax=Anastrepha ludens TaxID=28586 RepID=UPI0023AE8A92|nr:uncharacterized protein LOC128868206 [Anastrepha ludens]
MKLFVVACFLAGCAAAPNGYNYQPLAALQTPSQVYLPQVFEATSQVPASANIIQQQSSEKHYVPAQEAVYNKEFFSFSAPEEDFQEFQEAQKVAETLRKNIRVIFIKSPENHGIEHAAISLAKQAQDQQTAIFVLQKQHDLSELANKLNAVQYHRSHKPEVHFVKYRTPEDAWNAQRAIQAQFDSIQGTTQSTFSGIAPVLNFDSQSQVSVQAQPHSQLQRHEIYGVPTNNAPTIGSNDGYTTGGYSIESKLFGGYTNNAPQFGDNIFAHTNGQLAASSVNNLIYSNEATPSNSYLPALKALH